MAYVDEGNLYLQDGSNRPVQLTDSGEDGHPIFSDDGEEIVFFRGAVPHDLYAINADGSQERALVTNETLMALGHGYDDLSEVGNLSFAPGSHRLLLNTQERNSNGFTTNSRDLLRVDTDTGEVRSVFPPGQVSGFKVSPNGRLVAINMSGHVDIVTIDGQVVRRNLVTYAPTQPDELFPRLFWLPDSTELIVFLPAETEYERMGAGPPTYTVWRYALDGSAAVQVLIDPLPKGSSHPVSPDGNWILYEYLDHTIPIFEVYLGDLRNGSTRVYSTETTNAYWGPDSKHIILEGEKELFLGTVDNLPIPVDRGRFLGWVDDSRYLYFYIPGMVIIPHTETYCTKENWIISTNNTLLIRLSPKTGVKYHDPSPF